MTRSIRTLKTHVAATFAALLCLGTAGQAQTTLESLKSAGVVRHGLANDAPHGYQDKDGQLKGYEVEIAAAVMAKLGVAKIEPVITTFGALIPGVKANRFDFASDGMYIRADRCQQVRFARPHVMFGEGAVVRKGNPLNVLGIADLVSNPKIRIGMTTGGSQHKSFLMAGGDENQLLDYPDRATLVAALKSGRIDVALLTAMGAVGLYESSPDPDFELVSNFQPYIKDGKPVVSYAGYAFRPEDEDLAKAFETELTAYMATPEYTSVMKEYGLTDAMIPPLDMTAEAACSE